MLKVGLRLVIGSWKTMPMRLPRTPRMARSSSRSRSMPSKEMCPPSMWLGGDGISRRMDIAVTLVPQPDSPTNPTVRPAGTAIESPMRIAARFDLVKDAKLTFPRFTTAGPVSRHLDEKGYEVTTGIGPDLMEGARAAVSAMIDLLSARHGLAAVEAYMLCSVAADLRISEIVDQPNWLVSLYFPRLVFE